MAANNSNILKGSGAVHTRAIAVVAVLLLVVPFATAQDSFPKITPELYDELNANLDTTWPHDPAVPDLPPMPVTDDPAMNPDAFLWTRFDDNVYPPRVKGVPTPRTPSPS